MEKTLLNFFKLQNIKVKEMTFGCFASGSMEILIDLKRFEQGSNPDHGIQVKTYGDTSHGCATTGYTYSADDGHGVQMLGDLGTLPQDGEGNMYTMIKNKKAKLSGPLSIIGRAVVVYDGAFNPFSQNPINAPILGCCVIGYSDGSRWTTSRNSAVISGASLPQGTGIRSGIHQVAPPHHPSAPHPSSGFHQPSSFHNQHPAMSSYHQQPRQDFGNDFGLGGHDSIFGGSPISHHQPVFAFGGSSHAQAHNRFNNGGSLGPHIPDFDKAQSTPIYKRREGDIRSPLFGEDPKPLFDNSHSSFFPSFDQDTSFKNEKNDVIHSKDQDDEQANDSDGQYSDDSGRQGATYDDGQYGHQHGRGEYDQGSDRSSSDSGSYDGSDSSNQQDDRSRSNDDYNGSQGDSNGDYSSSSSSSSSSDGKYSGQDNGSSNDYRDGQEESQGQDQYQGDEQRDSNNDYQNKDTSKGREQAQYEDDQDQQSYQDSNDQEGDQQDYQGREGASNDDSQDTEEGAANTDEASEGQEQQPIEKQASAAYQPESPQPASSAETPDQSADIHSAQEEHTGETVAPIHNLPAGDEHLDHLDHLDHEGHDSLPVDEPHSVSHAGIISPIDHEAHQDHTDHIAAPIVPLHIDHGGVIHPDTPVVPITEESNAPVPDAQYVASPAADQYVSAAPDNGVSTAPQ
ncbi:hypothetical protein LOTGIDRAFT_154831 [Lottia gigantea]|uniref:Superoxide dismutase copper/zinc binding domain-containing protein n=1 Tax=Lottia gigantea TaxID=225164 RepID=V4BES6_LOTGI|nr:hypothetical protein LOTGIDRAFT_154831 [Lottia gigantea]ESO87334.1 hypothetical protein LOTGIDRAFT_154831 [Lottia gigantea]